MIYIYSNKKTNRLHFVLKFIFSHFLNSDYILIDSIEDFNSCNGIKINYSEKNLNCNLKIVPEKLLFEKSITQQAINVVQGERIYFFQQFMGYPFDLFAAIFYLISRYEEYLPNKKDKYERFPANESLAYKNNFLHLPLIDLWITDLTKELGITIKRKFTHQPIIDIDNAFAYSGKGIVRNFGAASKDLLSGKNINQRIATLSKKQKDPFDTFHQFKKIHKQYNCQPLYFVLIGNYGKYDKNVPHSSIDLQHIIKNLDGEIGIHPSFHSNQNPKMLKVEKDRLENIIGKEVTTSRQHYLKLSFPETYNYLIELGIKKDYSMAYPKNIGYRASTSIPFNFFDLKSNEEKPLLIHSSPIMDTTLNTHLNLTAEEAKKELLKTTEQIKSINGSLYTAWHNETISNWENWKNWQDVYPTVIAQIHQ